MKIDTPEIDKHRLVQMINREYNLQMDSIEFIPKGEEAYAYVSSDKRLFIRAQPPSKARPLEQAYQIIHALHTRCGISQIVAPLAKKIKR